MPRFAANPVLMDNECALDRLAAAARVAGNVLCESHDA